jgi:heterodisulfide reductase subunit B
MPIDRKRYPPDWEETSHRIRFERAGGRCELCGATHGEPHPKTGKTVQLQTAHLNRRPEETTDELLIALCPRCHFAYDRDDNERKKQATRRIKKFFGVLEIPFENGNSPSTIGSEL